MARHRPFPRAAALARMGGADRPWSVTVLDSEVVNGTAQAAGCAPRRRPVVTVGPSDTAPAPGSFAVAGATR